MKQKIFLILLVLELFCLRYRASAQVQHGQTCLFTCMNHIDKSRTVDQYIDAFNEYTGTEQDIYYYGASATVDQMIGFIKSQFKTVEMPFLTALDQRLPILSTVWTDDTYDDDYTHAVVFEAYYSKTTLRDPYNIILIFYNPAYGRHDEISYLTFMTSHPIYAVIINQK